MVSSLIPLRDKAAHTCGRCWDRDAALVGEVPGACRLVRGRGGGSCVAFEDRSCIIPQAAEFGRSAEAAGRVRLG